MNIFILRATDPSELPAQARSTALPAGFPFLVARSAKEVSVIEPAVRFLSEKFLRASKESLKPLTRSKSSILAVASDLKDWWDYLIAFQKTWAGVDVSDIAAYRDWMTSTISPYTHAPYAGSTVRRRLSSIIGFYEWTDRKGLTNLNISDTFVSGSLRRIDSNLLAHAATPTKTRNILQLPDRGPVRDLVKAMKPDEYQLIAKQLGTLPSARKEENGTCRKRLAAELALNTGLRIDEVCSLTKWQVLGLRRDTAHPHAYQSLRITKTKGSKPRTIRIPTWLVTELHAYIETERRDAVDAGRRAPEYQEPVELFLNGVSARSNAGRPFKPDSLDEAFRSAVIRCGLVEKVSRFNPISKAHYLIDRPIFTFHSLRHTFAILLYERQVRSGHSDRWKIVQSLLGHSSESTTKNIYLRACDELETIVSDRMDEELRRIRYAEEDE